MDSRYSRRNALRAIAIGAPVLAGLPVSAQSTTPSTNDEEFAAAERRLNGAIEALRKFPLRVDAEPAVIFKP